VSFDSDSQGLLEAAPLLDRGERERAQSSLDAAAVVRDERIGDIQAGRHLYLRRAGLVSDRKDGKWVHYRVAEPSDPNAARILREVLTWLRDDPEMRRDRERLARVCCAPQPPVSIQGAPRPAGFTA
jgi:DNA-binding transcriptional ArsR family regulator